MPEFHLKFKNTSTAIQDWVVYRKDEFQLLPGYRRMVRVELHSNYRFQISVDTENCFAHCDLTYDHNNGTWSVTSNTPSEWSLSSDGANITLSCSLENQADTSSDLKYEAEEKLTLNWSGVAPLSPPLTTTPDDVILSGHGAFKFHGETPVPQGFEFWQLAPLGASIADSLGQSLESMKEIVKLGLKNRGSTNLITMFPIIYGAGEMAPNLILQAPRGIIIKPGGPHVIGVEIDTPLSDLWVRVEPFRKEGEVVRVFWAACSVILGAKNPVVLGKLN